MGCRADGVIQQFGSVPRAVDVAFDYGDGRLDQEVCGGSVWSFARNDGVGLFYLSGLVLGEIAGGVLGRVVEHLLSICLRILSPI